MCIYRFNLGEEGSCQVWFLNLIENLNDVWDKRVIIFIGRKRKIGPKKKGRKRKTVFTFEFSTLSACACDMPRNTRIHSLSFQNF